MDNEKLLQAISDLMDKKFDERLEPINNRLDKIENRLDKIENRLDEVEDRLDRVENRFDKVENRLDVMEVKQNRDSKKLDDLQIDVKIAEREIKRDIHNLNDAMGTVIEILKLNDLLPG